MTDRPRLPQRAIALGLAALGLLSLVALASQGPLLRARTHNRPGHMPAWTTVVFAVLVLLAAAVLAYGIAVVRRDRRPKRTAGMWSVLIVVAVAAIASLIMHGHRHRQPSVQQKPATARIGLTPPPIAKAQHAPAGSGSTWLEVVILATTALVAFGVATRRRRQPPDGEPDDLLAALVDDSLEDLRAEPDPRRAVIAAYARMERGLGTGGLARAPAETAPEFLRRVLAHRRVSPGAATRLTGLFEQAKFSDHAIGSSAKQDAVAALEAVRDELRAGVTVEAETYATRAEPAVAP